MSDYIKHKEYKLPNGRTVTADFNELGHATITIQAMDALFDILNSSDVVEVVRCKDCKYMLQYEQIKACCNVNSFLQEPKCVSDNDFCSRGERAEA